MFVKFSSALFDTLIRFIIVIPAIILTCTLIGFVLGLLGASIVWFFELFLKGFYGLG